MSRSLTPARALRTPASLATIVLALLVGAPAASAGTYPMFVCDASDSRGHGSGPWGNFAGDSQFGTTYVNTCGNLLARFGVEDNSRTMGGTIGWRLITPDGISLTKVRYDGWGIDKGYANNGVRSFPIDCGDSVRGCSSGDGVNGPRTFTYATGNRTAEFGVTCGITTCTTDDQLNFFVYGMTVTLEESTDPTGAFTGGTLMDGSGQQGSRTVRANASDAHSGLHRMELRLGGVKLGERAYAASCGWEGFAACQKARSEEFTVDTTQVADGEHALTLVLGDAAGNNHVVDGGTVTVDNVPPPSLKDGSRPSIEGTAEIGKPLTALEGEWIGENVSFAYQWLRCDADGGGCVDIADATDRTYIISERDVNHRLKVRVTASNTEGSSAETSTATATILAPPAPENRTPADPPRQPTEPTEPTGPSHGPSVQAPHDRGPANGSGASDRVRLSAYVGTGRRTTIRARYGRSTRITGRLLDTGNQPISGATLQVQAGVRIPGSPFEDVGTVRTDRDGRYSYTLAAGPSRLVRFGYRSHAGDSQFADTTDVVVMVRAGVTLRPRPTRLRNGRTTTFSGRIARPVPTRGVLVDLQVRVGKKWRTFAVARSRRNGRYSFRYRFRNTYRTTTFKFRARARRDSRYPYLDGYSRIVKVHVRG